PHRPVCPFPTRRSSDLDRRARGETLREADLRLVVEIRPGHVEESPRLLLYRGDDLGVRVAGRGDRDARGEVEELVAVDVGDPEADRKSTRLNSSHVKIS